MIRIREVYNEFAIISFMKNDFNFELSHKTVENLELYSSMLNKDVITILNEALDQYFEKSQEKLEAANTLGADHNNTNLDFDEFWDNVDIE